MKRFLALYIGSLSQAEKATHEPDAAEQQVFAEGMKAWGEWMARHESAVVDIGSPLGRTLRAAPDGISPTENRIAAYVIVEAETHEDAARMFENHPHFSIMPGDSIEVLECLELPGSDQA